MADLLRATVTVTLCMGENETIEDAKDRLYDVLFDGLCNNADHMVDFVVEEMEGE